MKLIVLIFFTGVITNVSFSQDKDSEAQFQYVQAEEFYNAGKFNEAHSSLIKCEKILGTPNAKILYLRIKCLDTLFNFYPDSTILSLLRKDINGFFLITNSDTYPKDKYFEIIKLKNVYEELGDETKIDWEVMHLDWLKEIIYSEKPENILVYNTLHPISFYKDSAGYLASGILSKFLGFILDNKKTEATLSLDNYNSSLVYLKIMEILIDSLNTLSPKSFIKSSWQLEGVYLSAYAGFLILREKVKAKPINNNPIDLGSLIWETLKKFKTRIVELGYDKLEYYVDENSSGNYKNLKKKSGGNTSLSEYEYFRNFK